MKTRAQLKCYFKLILLSYLHNTARKKFLQHSVYCPAGVLGADSLGADISSTSSSGRSAISDVEVVGVARFSLEILSAFYDALLKSVRISACLKQVCFFLISMF
jgi:hypothetical protein